MAMNSEGTGHGSVERSFPRILNQVRAANIANGAVDATKLTSELLGETLGVTSVNGMTGDVTIEAGGGAVTSVNGQTGAVTVDVPVTSVNGQTGAVTVDVPVTSVNGQTGAVTVDVPVTSVNGQTGAVTVDVPVTSVNGQTGAVTVDVPVTSVNGQTGAVTITPPVTSVNGQTGAVTVAVPVISVNGMTGAVVLPEIDLPTAPTEFSNPNDLTFGYNGCSIFLEWSAVTAYPSVKYYEIRYSSDNGSTWTNFSGGIITSTNTTVTGLGVNNVYLFQVRAVNVLGGGAWSSIGPIDTTAPAV